MCVPEWSRSSFVRATLSSVQVERTDKQFGPLACENKRGANKAEEKERRSGGCCCLVTIVGICSGISRVGIARHLEAFGGSGGAVRGKEEQERATEKEKAFGESALGLDASDIR